MRKAMTEQFSKGYLAEYICQMRHKNGEMRTVLNRGRIVLDADGVERIYAVLVDLTKSRQNMDRMRQKLERYQIILDQAENIVFEWDIPQDELTVTERWKEIFGYEALHNHLLERVPTALHFYPEDISPIMNFLRGLKNGESFLTTEARVATAEGRYLWCRFRATTLFDDNGRPQRAVGIIQNIDAEKNSVQELQDRSERDGLTKLLNKAAAQQAAIKYLDRSSGEPVCALLVIDLDNFKQVNDRNGHMFGDAVLTQTAAIIQNLFRAQDVVGRIGGDEFMVLMRGVKDRKLLESRCRRLIESVKILCREQMELSCTVGIAMAPEHGVTYHELFRSADQALYIAKEKGKGRYLFYDKRNPAFYTRRQIGSSINAKIDSDTQQGFNREDVKVYIFRHLYSALTLETAIQDILAMIGTELGVDRVYIFENSSDNRLCSNTFEWCRNGVSPQMANRQNLDYERDFPGFREALCQTGVFYCSDVLALNSRLGKVLEQQNAKAMVCCPIMDRGAFKGYTGFDVCSAPRLWTKEQIDMLQYLSEMATAFLLKSREQEKLERRANDLLQMLDAQKTRDLVWTRILAN